ncbi:IclR family transcriptional regulator [uncultured Vagococcus sp.]|uniref:IclR family transcriptional regulator n=1 Tax=uncultured Vagococcus sp. TaxID=189676 RepID=UPI0028D2BB72|nr:IclR family transcriptional regulator [uncultured Vagococcus sp.]
MEDKKKPYGTVLVRASKIMDFLAASTKNECLKDIASATDMTTSTTLKILDTLLMIGYVTREKESKEYSLGPSLVRYANKYINDSILVKVATPLLEALQEQVDETIHLGIYSGNEVMYLSKLEPKKQSIYMTSKVGNTRPLYSSAMGKAILATFSDEELAEYLMKTEMIPFTTNTITNTMALKAEINQVRTIGVAFDDEEMEKDCFCIGAMIQLEDNQYGAFSVSMPKFRVTAAKKEELSRLIKATKADIEKEIMES